MLEDTPLITPSSWHPAKMYHFIRERRMTISHIWISTQRKRYPGISKKPSPVSTQTASSPQAAGNKISANAKTTNVGPVGTANARHFPPVLYSALLSPMCRLLLDRGSTSPSPYSRPQQQPKPLQMVLWKMLQHPKAFQNLFWKSGHGNTSFGQDNHASKCLKNLHKQHEG